jgi:Ca2+-binding EF-hand superfamily protein
MKTPRVTTALMLLSGCLALAAPTMAQAPDQEAPQKKANKDRPPLGKMLAEADANGDQRLSLEEIHTRFPEFPAKRFQNLDKNGDGALEIAELPGKGDGPKAPKLEELRAADTDQDHRVARTEFEAQFPQAPPAAFERMDKNKDGYLDRQDFQAATGDKGTPAKDDSRKMAGKKDEGSRAYLAKLIRDNDVNHDGQVTRDELLAAKPGFPASMFSTLDSNGDGVLAQTDVDSSPAREKQGKNDAAGAAPSGRASTGNDEKKRPELDVNQDGKITFEEARQVLPEFSRERFDARDRNGDGVLSKDDRVEKP